MTSNATAIRDAIFTRASAVAPAGAATWTLARKVAIPTLNTTQVPALQVVFVNDRMMPDGDENTGPIKFVVNTTIMISTLRAFDDPIALDGQADLDLDAILDALFNDGSFTNPADGSPFYFEGVESIDNVREAVQVEAEAYLLQSSLRIVFKSRCFYSPAAPNWLEEVDVTAGGAQTASATIEVGTLNYTVSGPSSGAHGVASSAFTVALEQGASFTGNQTISLSDGAAGGVFSPASTVIPANGATLFTFTYQPALAGLITITPTNGQGWVNPAPIVFTAT